MYRETLLSIYPFRKKKTKKQHVFVLLMTYYCIDSLRDQNLPDNRMLNLYQCW